MKALVGKFSKIFVGFINFVQSLVVDPSREDYLKSMRLSIERPEIMPRYLQW